MHGCSALWAPGHLAPRSQIFSCTLGAGSGLLSISISIGQEAAKLGTCLSHPPHRDFLSALLWARFLKEPGPWALEYQREQEQACYSGGLLSQEAAGSIQCPAGLEETGITFSVGFVVVTIPVIHMVK